MLVSEKRPAFREEEKKRESLRVGSFFLPKNIVEKGRGGGALPNTDFTRKAPLLRQIIRNFQVDSLLGPDSTFGAGLRARIQF